MQQSLLQLEKLCHSRQHNMIKTSVPTPPNHERNILRKAMPRHAHNL
jgi:hypothetical protein